MRSEYNFTQAQRGPVIPSPGKTRITIMLDDDILAHFRAQAEASCTGYQTMINAALRESIRHAQSPDDAPVTVGKLREVLEDILKRR